MRKKTRKFDGYLITRKNGVGAGWVARSMAEVDEMVCFIAKSEHKTLNDYNIEPYIF